MPNWARNLLLIATSSVIAAGLICIAFEVYFLGVLDVDRVDTRDMHEFDSRLGWRPLPGDYRYFEPGAGRAVALHINEHGLRNGPVGFEAPSDKRRLTVVGDSFVFGAELNDDETITAQLAAIAGRDRVEVINTAVQGYGTGQQYLLLKDLMSKGFQVGEAVVIVFFTNDIQDNLGLDYGTNEVVPWKPAFAVDSSCGIIHTRRPAERPSATSKRDRLLFWPYLQHQAALVYARFDVVRDAAAVVGVELTLSRTPGVVRGWYDSAWKERWDNTAAILDCFVRFLRTSTSAEVYLVFIPSPFQAEPIFSTIAADQESDRELYRAFLDDPARPQRVLAEFATVRDIPFIDTTEALREHGRTAPVYFLRDGHLNATGAGVVAGELRDALFR